MSYQRIPQCLKDLRYMLNPLRAEFIRGNKACIYILCPSFTLKWHIQLKYFLDYLLRYLFYMVNNVGADVLTIQGARASATMILTELSRFNSVNIIVAAFNLHLGCKTVKYQSNPINSSLNNSALRRHEILWWEAICNTETVQGLSLRPANERRCYIATMYLIGWDPKPRISPESQYANNLII